jgi:glycosyltransferase involved in cell wall biosynthesis
MAEGQGRMAAPPSVKSVVVVDPRAFTLPYDRKFCAALAAAGVEVTLVGRPLADTEASNDRSFRYLALGFNPPIRRTFVHNLSWDFRRVIAHISHAIAWTRLIIVLYRTRPDVLHAQWLPVPFIDVAFICLVKKFIPIVLTAHDVQPYMGTVGPRSMRAWLQILSSVHHIFVHTRAGVDELISLGIKRERVTLIAHGPLHLKTLKPQADLVGRRTQQLLRFVQFGMMKEYKGIDVLLRAIALMPSDVRARCHFVVAGTPAMDLRPLEKLIRDAGIEKHVELVPRYFSEEEVGMLLASADVFVFPYRRIQASGVLALALNLDCPIVASSLGSFREILVDGHHGFLVSPDDPPSLANALTSIALDEALRVAMGRNIAQLRSCIPDWDLIAGHTIEIYKEVVGRFFSCEPDPAPEAVD